MNRKPVLIFGLFIVLSSACFRSEGNDISPGSSNATNSDAPSPERHREVFKEGGWQIPALKGSVAVKRIERKSEIGPKTWVTRYVPGQIKGKSPVLEQTLFSDEERAILGLFPSSYGDLMVSDIWAYDIAGRKFCYVIRMHPQGIPATMILHFYDLDGDGRFELARMAASGIAPDLLPDWAG